MVSAHYTCLHFPYDTEDVRVNVKSKLDRCDCCTFHIEVVELQGVSHHFLPKKSRSSGF